MRRIIQALLIAFLIPACAGYDPYHVDGFDVRDFLPHRAASCVVTPGGHYRDAGPFDSVLGAFVDDAEIDDAVDAGFARFAVLFPELRPPSNCRVNLNDDYVMYVPRLGWAAGLNYGPSEVFVCLWTRTASATEPVGWWIARPPNSTYDYWRYAAPPLVPALCHELLHSVIGDASHASPLWRRL